MLGPAADLAFQPLLEDAFAAAFPVGHELADRPRLYWRDVAPHDLILLSRGSSVRELYDEAMEDRPSTAMAASRYDVTHMTTAIRLVRQGLGITVLPSLALPELDQGLAGVQAGGRLRAANDRYLASQGSKSLSGGERIRGAARRRGCLGA